MQYFNLQLNNIIHLCVQNLILLHCNTFINTVCQNTIHYISKMLDVLKCWQVTNVIYRKTFPVLLVIIFPTNMYSAHICHTAAHIKA